MLQKLSRGEPLFLSFRFHQLLVDQIVEALLLDAILLFAQGFQLTLHLRRKIVFGDRLTVNHPKNWTFRRGIGGLGRTDPRKKHTCEQQGKTLLSKVVHG